MLKPRLVTPGLAAAVVALVAAAGLLLAGGQPAEAAPAPTLTSVSPALGPSAGGTAVTLTGTGFVVGATVSVGGSAAGSVVVGSSTQITAVTPAGTPGSALVTVTNTDGQSTSLGGGFTYQYPPPTATLIAPNTGSSAGGTPVTITGTEFRAGATVTIGGVAATNVVVVNATTITATTPARPIGVVNVVVANSDAQSATMTSAYTYTAAASPTVSSVAPASGTVAGGTAVTVAGTGFVTGATVTFGGIAATNVVVVNATSITATTPARSTTGAVTVVVANPDTQSGALGSGFTYNPLPAPTATNANPATGAAAGGTSITISGTGFVAGATVTIGGAAATSVVVTSATTITAVTPSRPAGAASVTVTNPDGQSATAVGGFTYAANAAPTATGVSPAKGSVSGGTLITITGTGFLSGATVKIGGTDATEVTVVSSTSITAVTPAKAAGSATVMVINPDGQSVTTSTGFTYEADAAPTITTISPDAGPLAGSTVVTITGSGFKSDATVAFGSLPASSVTVSSATVLTATTPAHAAGSVDVIVTNADGQSATETGGFTYQGPAPTVLSITPDNGPAAGGTVVTIIGSGFQAGAVVTFGGVKATDSYVLSDTELTATVPSKSETGAVDVAVANPNGAPATVSAGYTYRAAGAATVAAQPPAGGFVLVVTGTADLQALIKAQKFTVQAVFLLDVGKQEWKTHVVGGPAIVNTLKAIKATDIVLLARAK
jgi:hypothetical protein